MTLGNTFLTTSGDSLPTPTVMTTEGTAGTASANSDFTGSIFDLGARGGNYVCSVSSSGTGNTTTGTVRIMNGNMRGDFESTIAGKRMTSSILKRGDTSYYWGSAMKQGVKMNVPQGSVQSGQSADLSGQGEISSQSFGWSCKQGSAADSDFVVPDDVEFMDMDAMMQGIPMPKPQSM